MKELQEVQVLSSSEAALSEDLLKFILELKNQDTNFNLDRFLEGAKKAYLIVSEALIKNDKEALDFFLEKEFNPNLHEWLKTIDSLEILEGVIFGDRALITLLIKGVKNYQVTFSRYIKQEKTWKISKIVEEKSQVLQGH